MTGDGVDDLQYAEAKLAAAGLADDYCRPTCGHRLTGECEDGEETCGCLCGHAGPTVEKTLAIAVTITDGRVTGVKLTSAGLYDDGEHKVWSEAQGEWIDPDVGETLAITGAVVDLCELLKSWPFKTA